VSSAFVVGVYVSSKHFPQLFHGEPGGILVQIARDGTGTVGKEKRRHSLEARRGGEWAAVGKLAPSAIAGHDSHGTYSMLGGPGALGASQGDGCNEELRVRMFGSRDFEVDDHRVGVSGPGLLHKLLHIDAPAHFRAKISETIEGVGPSVQQMSSPGGGAGKLEGL
jgi:hypothetical protein